MKKNLVASQIQTLQAVEFAEPLHFLNVVRREVQLHETGSSLQTLDLLDAVGVQIEDSQKAATRGTQLNNFKHGCHVLVQQHHLVIGRRIICSHQGQAAANRLGILDCCDQICDRLTLAGLLSLALVLFSRNRKMRWTAEGGCHWSLVVLDHQSGWCFKLFWKIVRSSTSPCQ